LSIYFRMKKKRILATFTLLAFCSNLYSQNSVQQGLKQITPQLIQGYVDYLASDKLLGRDTPSPELDTAADFIVKQLKSFGIKPVKGSYFQNIPFCAKDLDVKNCILRITVGGVGKKFNLKSDYIPFEATANTSVASEIVFAGYGITAKEYNYDDYKDIDVNGKIVLILKHEPGEKDTKSPFFGDQETKYSFPSYKFENAIKHGAIAVLLVTDPLNHSFLFPQGYGWSSLSNYTSDADLRLDLCISKPSIPLIQVGESVIESLFGSVDSLKSVQRRIDRIRKPQSYILLNSKCELATKLLINEVFPKNIVGIIEGSDKKLRKEIVIVGGHYDHIGYMPRHRNGDDFVFNGADDNASGTAGVLAIAKALTSIKQKPKRSILFVLFAGEEKGLYGSEYYCSNPLFPLEKTVAMFNLDMISRNGMDTLNIEGDKEDPDLARIVRKENVSIGLKIVEPQEDLFRRSDQYNFFLKNISVIGFTSGLHKDYHTLRDKPQAIIPEKSVLISKLAFRTIWVVANEKKHYAIIKQGKFR
jgi:hypothetical protein